jgi:hypothetical protein
MTYCIGELELQCKEPSNVVHLVFGRKITDGGKARLQRRRLLFAHEGSSDLSMVSADVVDTSPSEMNPA